MVGVYANGNYMMELVMKLNKSHFGADGLPNFDPKEVESWRKPNENEVAYFALYEDQALDLVHEADYEGGEDDDKILMIYSLLANTFIGYFPRIDIIVEGPAIKALGIDPKAIGCENEKDLWMVEYTYNFMKMKWCVNAIS